MEDESSYDAYIARRNHDGTVTYNASLDWTNFIANGVKDTLNFNPPIIFMTFNTASGDLGGHFKPDKGYMRKGVSDIKSLALWFDG